MLDNSGPVCDIARISFVYQFIKMGRVRGEWSFLVPLILIAQL